MTSPLVLVDEITDDIVRLTFNRPEQRNAMNSGLREQFRQTLRRYGDSHKVVIITGSGTAFCAGLDLKESTDRASGMDVPWPDANASWTAVQDAIRTSSAIVIAAVNGFALGGGSTLINACDLAIASVSAQIGMPEVGFGSYPGLAAPAMQLRISPKRAAWMVLTARRVDGKTAEDWGIVNRCVPAEELETAAVDMATDIAQFDREVLKWSKRALWEIPLRTSDWDAALRYGTFTNARIREESGGNRESLEAFARGERNVGQGATRA